MFSDGFLEGQTKDINEGFPSDSFPYTDHYDYLSDSDLEDEFSCFEGEEEEPAEDGEQELPRSSQDSDTGITPAGTSDDPPWPSPAAVSEVGNNSTSAPNPANPPTLSC